MNIDNFHPLLLNIGKAVLAGNWNWHNVCSPFARIYYVVAGRATVQIADRKLTLKPGHMYLVPPFTEHSTSCDRPFTHYYIHVYEDSDKAPRIFDNYDMPLELEATSGDMQLFERLAELHPGMTLKQYDPESYDNRHALLRSIVKGRQSHEWLKMETRGSLYILCSRFMQQAKAKAYNKDKRVQQAVRYMQEHLAEPISVRQLAEDVSLSPAYFIRLFSDVIGTTPLLFINRKRIERAQLLLHTTDLPIKEIASRLGYEDNSYFVRAFKRNTGCTPSQYRRNINC